MDLRDSVHGLGDSNPWTGLGWIFSPVWQKLVHGLKILSPRTGDFQSADWEFLVRLEIPSPRTGDS